MIYIYLVVMLLASLFIVVLIMLKFSLAAKWCEYPRRRDWINSDAGEPIMYLEEDDERARKSLSELSGQRRIIRLAVLYRKRLLVLQSQK